jgi:TonB family protein
MDVTDVLRDRMQEPDGLLQMTSLSIAAHAALVAAIFLVPGRWLAREAEAPRTVMTITLGGSAPGPSNGGLTTTGGRPVQTTEPPETARREAIRPPAAKTPEMELPRPGTKPIPRATPGPVVKQAPDDARGRVPTRGTEGRAGSAIAETGARGQGFGLSTGGGAGFGSFLDVANFCCPDYLVLMTERVRANWNPQSEVAGETLVKFTIQRDGRVTDVAIEKPSGYTALDLTAQRALALVRQLPPLPAEFTNPTLTVHLNFQYQR